MAESLYAPKAANANRRKAPTAANTARRTASHHPLGSPQRLESRRLRSPNAA